MKLVIDENISFAKEAFGKIGKVKLMHGREITNKDLNDVDVLIVRSITKVNKSLLENTNVKFVGTATIGRDHIDIDYLNEAGIAFSDAKGCNAYAVVEYVITAITEWANRNRKNFSDLTLGIVGVGEIGSKVDYYARKLGLKTIPNDPPRQRTETGIDFYSLEEVFEADIITIHTPLTLSGADKTFHLFNEKNLFNVKEGSLFINAARGEVVDNKQLINLISKKNLEIVLDVWENEPAINTELLKLVNVATPHVAGYSLEGKVNGTKIIYDALCKHFKITATWKPLLTPPADNFMRPKDFVTENGLYDYILKSIYDIKADSEKTKNNILSDLNSVGKNFDLLRKNYSLRREFNNYFIPGNIVSDKWKQILASFRFNFI